MYKLMISFPDLEFTNLERFGLGSAQKEYFLADEYEVCKVITSLSHLNPVIILFSIDYVTAEQVLKDFEVKEV